MDRVKTGVPGLDPLIDGGIPEGFNVLIVGRPGTGKTIMGLQYLYDGAMNGENGLYITVDAKSDLIRQQGKDFGWDIEKLEADRKLCLFDIPLNMRQRLSIFPLIRNRIKDYKVKRVVFDSLSSFAFNMNQFVIDLPTIDVLSNLPKADKEYFENDIMPQSMEGLDKRKPDSSRFEVNQEKRIIYLMFREFSTWGTTNIVITSSSADNREAAMDGVSEFVADGDIKLEVLDTGGGPARVLRVIKMRKTKNALEFHNLDITDKGIVVR